mmetsp:Transcript_14250/g.22192  ORF Transcript_14250/g.22192 Transcript_14250/m.22192 type:complete len:184 (-) Transcript_14250:58-609(-)
MQDIEDSGRKSSKMGSARGTFPMVHGSIGNGSPGQKDIEEGDIQINEVSRKPVTKFASEQHVSGKSKTLNQQDIEKKNAMAVSAVQNSIEEIPADDFEELEADQRTKDELEEEVNKRLEESKSNTKPRDEEDEEENYEDDDFQHQDLKEDTIKTDKIEQIVEEDMHKDALDQGKESDEEDYEF